jgi:hypothetical protein
MAIDNTKFQTANLALYNIVCAGTDAGSIGDSCPKDFDWGTELYAVRVQYITKTITNNIMSLTIADDAKVYGIVINKDNDNYNSFKIQNTISNVNNQSNNAFQITLTNINLSTKAQRNLTNMVAYKDYVFFVYQQNANAEKTMFVVGASNGGAIQAVINDSGNKNDTYGDAITLSGNSVIAFTQVADTSAELLLEKLVDEDGEYVVVAP